MACFHPLPARRLSLSERLASPDPSRKVIVFPEGSVIHPFLDENTGDYLEPFAIPCGKCVGCRLAYSRDWANRCVTESLCYPEENSFFVTLTYDNNHVHFSKHGTLTLHIDDVSIFMKDLRRYYKYHFDHDNIRFYAGSEYGSDTFRPHYHLILFNISIPDLEQIVTNFQGDPLYHSPLLEKIWGRGFVVVGKFSWNTAAYTARYVMKKRKGPDAGLEYLAADLEPESSRCSRRPGIGMEYFTLHMDDIYEHDKIVLPSNGNVANVVKPPKAFDRAFTEVDPLRMARIKSNRVRAAELAMDAKMRLNTYTQEEYFRVCESIQNENAKKLIRKFKDLT